MLYVDNGQVVTGAGTAAGIDALLHLVRREWGAAPANALAREMVVPPHRDGGQAQYIDAPVAPCEDDRLGAVLDWAVAHLAEEVTVDVLARRALMSPVPSPAGSRPPPARRRTPGCWPNGSTRPKRCWRAATPRSRRWPGWSISAPPPGSVSSSPAAAGDGDRAA